MGAIGMNRILARELLRANKPVRSSGSQYATQFDEKGVKKSLLNFVSQSCCSLSTPDAGTPVSERASPAEKAGTTGLIPLWRATLTTQCGNLNFAFKTNRFKPG